MRPYLAVIIDSFRSAFASRVLWVALAAIYFFLIALAPIGYKEVFTTTFRWPDFANGTRMKAMLAKGINELDGVAQDADETVVRETPQGRIARSLPDELQRNLQRVAEGHEVRIRLDVFADGLNELYASDDWYDARVWESTPRLRELRELESLPPGELTEELRQRRARLRIEAALPGVFESRGSRSIALTYAGIAFPTIFQVEKAQFQLLLNHFALRMIIDWVLGFAMIFLGILVTAAIIPDMLQPGTLHLLLSKPVSRSLLFLAKFLGGCAFVFVCVSQLIIGLWLISGLRLDVWNARLLWCIPVCVFLFAVFYSVSAVAGLRWRSPILAIGLANLFGAGCLVIGLAGSISDSFITERDRISGLAVSGDAIVAATRGGNLRRYDDATRQWVSLFPDDGSSRDRIIPPVTLADGRIVTARVRGGRLNVFGSGATPLLLLEPSTSRPPQPSIELPAGTAELFALADGALLAANSGELMIAEAKTIRHDEPEEPAEPEDTAQEVATAPASPQAAFSAGPFGAWLPKLIKMMGGPSDGFSSILPERVSLVAPSSVVLGASGSEVLVYSGGKILRLRRPEATGGEEAAAGWIVDAQTETVTSNEPVWLGVIGDVIVLLRGGEEPLFFDATLQPLELEGSAISQLANLSILSAVSCHGAGAVAIVTGQGQVWQLQIDAQRQVFASRLGRTREVETLHWDEASERLWIAHHVDRVSAWELAKESEGGPKLGNRHVITYRPAVGGWRLVDRYLITPLRFITPQTGEVGETIASIVSGENALQVPFVAAGVEPVIHRYNVWRPVLTCGGFILVMLTVGCVYFSRTDF
jgi:hypothetical protein